MAKLQSAAGRDIITGGVVVVATALFVINGGQALSGFVQWLQGVIGSSDRVIAIALMLNIALILFGWRRYAELQLEIEERVTAEAQARNLAQTDPLTGLINRRALGEFVSDMMQRAQRRHKVVAFQMIDLDAFKKINDLYGHDAGDELLLQFARRFREAAPGSAILARLGGDEFACVHLFDAEHPEQVDRVAEAVVEIAGRSVEFQGMQLNCTASVGIARSDFDCDTPDKLMRRADIAMYAAKNTGRNRHVWFDAQMEIAMRRRNSMEAAMRAGIPRGEFVPYFEQQVDLSTGRILGFEMLARWHSPTGIIGPDDFIPLAEEIGLIGDLSLSVMRQAFLEAKSWDPSLTLSVNISPVQLLDPWMGQKLVKLLVETGFPPQRLEVEITESSLFENLGLAQSIVGSLKNQGIRIALDDFGTGYSSLAHLRALPFDRIKIDRSFVSSMQSNSESAAIVRAISGLGESLGLPITAEGIEDEATAEYLRSLGSFKGQGWRYGKPLSTELARALLAEQDLLPGATGAGHEPQDAPASLTPPPLRSVG